MFRVRRLKLLYALIGLAWAGYYSVKLLATHVAARLSASSCSHLFRFLAMFFCLSSFPWPADF